MVSQGHGPASADREDDLCVVDTHSDDGNDRPVEYPIANNRSSVDKLKLQASSSSGGDESSDSDSEHESVGVKKSSGKKAKKTKTGEKPKTGTAEKTNTAEKFKTAKKKKNANIEPSSVKASAADTVLPAEVGRPKSESSADESNSGGATSSSSSSGDSSETNDSDSDSDSDQESVDDKKSAENKTKKAKTAKTTKTTKKVANAHGEESSVEAKAANTLLSAESQPNEVGGDDVSAALGHDDVPPEVMQHNLGKGVAAGGGGAAVVTATANNASDEAPQAQPNVGHSGRDNSAQAESVDDAGEIKDEVCGQGDIVHRRSTGAVTNNDGAGTASDSDATSHKSDHSIRSDRATSNSTMSTHRASNKIVKRTSDALTDSSSSSDSSDDEDMTGKDAEYIRMKEHRHNVRVRQYRSEIVALRAEHAAIQAARREDLNVQKDYTSDLSSSSSRDSSSDELSYAEGRSLVARLRRKVARGKAKLSASRMSRKMSKEGEITHVESGVHRTDSTPKASKSSSLGSAGADTHADAVKGEEKIQLSDGKVVAVSAVDGRKADLEVKLNRGEINVPLERYSPDSVQGEHKYKPAGVVVVGAVKTAAAASIPADDYVDVSDVPDGTGNEVADDRVVDSDVSDINGSADVSVELSAEGEAGHSTEEVVDAEKNIAVSASPSGSQTKSDGDMCPNPTKMDGVDVEVLRVAIAKLQVEYRAIQVTLDEYEQMEDEYLEAMNSCGDNGDEASRLTELAQKLKRLMLGAKARLMGSNGGRQSIPARKGVDHHSEDREADEVSHRAEGVAVGVGATIVAGAVSAQKHHGTDQRNGKTKETRSTEQQTDTAANTQNGVTGRSDKDKRDSPVQGHVKENVEAVTGDLKGVASDSKISPSEMLVHVMSGLEDVPVMDAETETNLRDSSPPFERLDLMAYENSTAGTPSPQTQDVAEIGAMVDSLRTEHNKLLASQARFCEDVSELQATEQVQIETGSFCSNTDSGTEKTLERRRDQLKRKIARGRARWAAQRAMKAEAKAEKQMASNTTPYRGSGGVSQASTSSTVDTQSGGNKSDGVETLQGSGQRGSREGGAEGNASAIDSIAPEVAPSKLAQDEGVIASEEYVSGKERNEPLPGDSSVSSLRSMVASLRVEHASLKILHEQRAAAAVAESSKPDPVQHNGTVQARNTTSSDSSSGSGEESYLRRIFHHMKKKITHVKEKRQRAKEAKVIERVSTVGKSGPSSKVGSKGGMVADAGGS
ncbi:hypothetical protein SARC_11717 [Sphaeroforma arctica JP610]|uniref:Uncharacterized protein n=1 Tax=Sphaeroforma arctica JP610 TaxID=667725 RepID=A0A0L0FG64_9EUKA|nr:hypothetical protein SARC_11717 [Sphaeroforma arctica JP610]KNC75764.1 hypothetical protein SARC_11717 [Sphaeroforma arctica JP610]|eukprot:XP_014149666.1 hypothetical protein SARC_11717 [Sphaeroforma arctica JP610]